MPDPLPDIAYSPWTQQAGAEDELRRIVSAVAGTVTDIQGTARAALDQVLGGCEQTDQQCKASVAGAIDDLVHYLTDAYNAATGGLQDALHKELAFTMAIAQEAGVSEPPLLITPATGTIPPVVTPPVSPAAGSTYAYRYGDPLPAGWPDPSRPPTLEIDGQPGQIVTIGPGATVTPAVPVSVIAPMPAPWLVTGPGAGELTGTVPPQGFADAVIAYSTIGGTAQQAIRLAAATTAPQASPLPDVAASSLATGGPQPQTTPGGATQTQTGPAGPSETSSTSSPQGSLPASCPPPIINVEPATCPAAGAATPIIQGDVVQVYGSEQAWLVGGSVDRLMRSIQQFYGDIPVITGTDDDPQQTLAPFFDLISPATESTSASYPG